MSLLDESGPLAIATRLLRLSEQIRRDGFLVYKENGIDFQPKWFPVLYILHHKPVLSVLELAAEIGYTHPSTITLLKELEKEKLVRSKKDKQDERKRLIQLSAKGEALLRQMQPVWHMIAAAATELLDTPHNLLAALTEVENQLSEKSFLARAKAYAPTNNAADPK
ncbi:MarR family winged helix-turn-helix transcriptional regulator [Hymenobacter caeli]|uniref:DNA-binding MarR family transcriptional regulator n=1 Tax=Hymenobacter caeli TaxID=2735894 RepID=A0ABX2FVF1_9BACT|nr:MarR family winged helix-turn-helix transcriptional regulator [Hymenobacter caeli]NRT21166.1 DNA-binding MarR family transcriptional regulator [Hymenobacter caeli]